MFWTPGHADVQGNEVADRLAKDAAKEAQELDQNTCVLTNQDIKKAARDSIMEKWQDKWSISITGRKYFQYRPKILPIPRFDFPDHQGFILLLHGCILEGIGFLPILSILMPTRKSGIRRDKYLSAAIFKEAVHSDDS